MEKKKLILKKEVIATLTNENLHGGVDVIDDKRTKYPLCIIESGLCVIPLTRQANCLKETILCLQTNVCIEPTRRCLATDAICLAKTVKCFELG